MAAISGSTQNFTSTFCPCWCSAVPQKTLPDQQVSGDWAQVTVQKYRADGTRIDKIYQYHMELSTGDLYGIPNMRGELDAKSTVAVKAGMMFVATPFYMVGMAVAQLFQAVTAITSIFWKSVPQIKGDYEAKGAMEALANFTFSVVYEIPAKLMHLACRFVLNPFHAGALALACAYTIIKPLEGRVWISKAESAWHEGATYRDDLRYGSPDIPEGDDLISHIWAGKIQFLGWCMQKRGNVQDQVSGVSRFRILETSRKPVDVERSDDESVTFRVTYNGKTQKVVVEKLGDEWMPRSFSYAPSQMPKEDCIAALAEGIEEELGTSRFACGTIKEVLSPSFQRFKRALQVSIEEELRTSTYFVTYNGTTQGIVLEQGWSHDRRKVKELHFDPRGFPTVEAKMAFIGSLEKKLGEVSRLEGTDPQQSWRSSSREEFINLLREVEDPIHIDSEQSFIP